MAMTEEELRRRRPARRTTTLLPSEFRILPAERPEELQSAVRDLTRSVRGAPITERDIMRSPSFQAQQQVIDFNRREREAGTRRDLASRGILRSTPSVQALEAEGARADAAIAAVVPQLLEAARAREQQNVANQLSLVSTLSGLQNTGFQQGLSEFNALAPFRFETPSQRLANAATEASLTGRFLSPDARDLFQQVIDLKQQAAVSPADIPALNQAANEIRAQIQAMGFDPSIVGADVSLDQAVRNIRQAGTLTPTQRELEAGLTGVDPITGQPTFAAREAAAGRAAAAARTGAGTGQSSGLTPNQIVGGILDAAARRGEITDEQARKLNEFGIPIQAGPFGEQVVTTEGLTEDERQYLNQSAQEFGQALGAGTLTRETALRQIDALERSGAIRQEVAKGLREIVDTFAPAPPPPTPRSERPRSNATDSFSGFSGPGSPITHTFRNFGY